VPVEMNVERNYDPELAAAILPLPPSPFLTPGFGPAEFRSMQAASPQPVVPEISGVQQRDLQTSGDMARQLTVRVWEPTSTGRDRPCIYWLHGGGLISGTALAHDARLVHWVNEFGCTVVAPEYRLAPEHPYPAGLEDCYAGLRWTVRCAADLGIEDGRIVLAGRSAGAGLAAALALALRDRGELNVAYQLLIFPMLDDRGTTASSHLTGPLTWPREANELAWAAYLGELSGAAEVPYLAAPARASVDELVGLPATWLGVGTLDLFRDENIEFARRLLRAAVPTELHVFPGLVHGFDIVAPDISLTRAFNQIVDDALRRALSARSY
jgi:acetyl esterase/lipase